MISFFKNKIPLIAMLINAEIKYRISCVEPLLLNLHTSLSNMVRAAQQSLGATENIRVMFIKAIFRWDIPVVLGIQQYGGGRV
jgi:hypothetical protein